MGKTPLLPVVSTMVTWALDGVPTLTTPPVEEVCPPMDTLNTLGLPWTRSSSVLMLTQVWVPAGPAARVKGYEPFVNCTRAVELVKMEVTCEHMVICGVCPHVLQHWVPLWDKL